MLCNFIIMKIIPALLLSAFICTAHAQPQISITRDTTVKLPEAKTFYDTVDVKPKFKGNLSDYLVKNLHLPKGAKPGGKIVAQFWIDSSGKITHVEILDGKGRPPANAFEKEVVRVVKAMPAWQPGMYKGKKVTVRYSLPLILK